MSQEPLKSPESVSTPAQPNTTTPASDHTSPSRSKPRSLLRMLGQLFGIVLALIPALLELLGQLWQLIWPVLKWFGKQWILLLPKIRTVLPAGLNKLPDQAITATALALLLLLFLIPRAFSPDRSPAVVTAPTPTEAVEQPDESPPVRTRPDPNAKRIATIQNQITEVTTPYAEDLVQAVQAFAKNRLLISVTDRWNTLEDSQRERLANELLKRSKKLKFEQLEITDAEGTTLARSPVVGSHMVLLLKTAA